MRNVIWLILWIGTLIFSGLLCLMLGVFVFFNPLVIVAPLALGALATFCLRRSYRARVENLPVDFYAYLGLLLAVNAAVYAMFASGMSGFGK